MTNKRTKVILIFSLLFFVAGLLSCGILWFVIIAEGNELNEKATAVAEFRAEEQAVNSLARLVEDTTTERAELVGYILERDEVPRFLTDLEMFAVEQRVTLETNNIQEINTETANELVIALTILGNRNSLLHFYEMLETLPYHGYLSTLLMEQNVDTNTGAVTWESEVVLTISVQES